MTQDWDEILSQRVERLRPDLPAAKGGWRGVSPIEDVSPRPQQPPLTLPDSKSMLSIRLPVQAEDRPPSAPPPDSLTDQLSLTWATRKVRARVAAASASEPEWPERSPEPQAAPAEDKPQGGPFWRRPLQMIGRVLRPEASPAETPAMAPEPDIPARPGAPPATSPPTSPPPSAPAARPVEARPQPQRPKPAIGGDTSLPLTLAQAPRPPEPAAATQAQPAPPPPAAAPGSAARPAEPVPERTLGEVLRRDTPVEARRPAQPQTPATVDRTPDPARLSSAPAPPLIHKESVVAPDPAAPPSPEVTAAPADAPVRARSGPPQSSTPGPARPEDQGEPLSPVLRSRMEGLVDVPLHQVRVFRNSISGALASSQHADAVTVENQVHMAPAKGTASTPSGEALLAHEVSHYAARLAGGPASRAVSPQQEEAQAQATEHAVRQQSESVSQPPKAQPPAATLDHLRAAPAAAAQATRASDGSRTAFSGGSAPAFSVTGGAASASMVLARAPVNRIPETGQGAAPSLPSPAAGGAQPGAAALDDGRNEPDEATMVGRVVEAVMRRLRRESALERERRGAFRSEIGG